MGLNAKDLKSLSRGDLLELLLAQTERVEELDRERTELKAQLETKNIMIEKSGTLAEAALAINQVFQAADRATAQYLGNIMRLYDEQMEKNAVLEREYARKMSLLSADGAVAAVDLLTAETEAPSEQKEIAPTALEAQKPAVSADAIAQAEALKAETNAKCESMLREASEQCKTMLQEVTEKCDAMELEITTKCVSMEQDAAAKCEAMILEASSMCRTMEQEVTAKCEALKEDTQIACAAAELESQAKCREAEESTERACNEMKQKAKEEAETYMKKAYAKLKKYISEHGELNSLMKTKG